MSLSPSPPPVRRKKPFMFKRANLVPPAETNNKDDLGFFSRREQNYSGVTGKPKEEPKKETKKSHTPEDPEEGGGSPPKRAKRRSFAGDDEDSGEDISGTQRLHSDARQRYKNAIVLSDSDDPEPRAKNSRSPKSKSKNRESRLTPPPVLYTDPEPVPYSSSSPSSSPPNAPPSSHTGSDSQSTGSLKQATPINDDDDIVLVTNKPPAPTPAPVNEEDEYIAALEKRARERARAQRTPNSPFLTSPPADPVVSILVSSKIEGTKPLVLRRRVNQPLKPVRIIWCQKQNFTEDQAAEIFLTWRGNKVFDHNSCRGIGITVDDLDDREGSSENNIYFEAMTAEGFAEMERERERGYSVSGVSEEEEEEVPEKEEVIMRLTLKSKGYEDFRIKVRPETKISKLISAFRIAWKVPDDKEITLDFDGDNLDPEETVGDTELEDMFGIDVYIS